MRFSVPRSLSPSPVRTSKSRSRTTTPKPPHHPRKSFSFGLHSDSDSEEDASSASDVEDLSTSSSESHSFVYASESEVPPRPSRTRRIKRSWTEQRAVNETVGSIKLRTRHVDVYENWERNTRESAYRAAKKIRLEDQVREQERLAQSRRQAEQARTALHQRQTREVENVLSALRIQEQTNTAEITGHWNARTQNMWRQLEHAIAEEEAAVQARVAAEQQRREAEQKQREAEERERARVQAEQEAQRAEQERARQQKADEERKEREERETAEREAREAEERAAEMQRKREERERAEEEQRKAIGMTSVMEDWTHARNTLDGLKAGPMKVVKNQKPLKQQWGAIRRQITPKVGQLTNDSREIARISNQLVQTVGTGPGQPHPPDVYFAALSSLAKAILLQAETEVTAEKRSARPLGLVTANLLSALPSFDDVFFAKLVQRTGPWAIPTSIPPSALPPDAEGKRKALGYRKEETQSEYEARVTGIMRVYFEVLRAPVTAPLHRMFQTPRYWAYFGRIIADEALCDAGLAPELLYVALDTGGEEAKAIWGAQWIKLLALLYEGASDNTRNFGGTSPEAKAGRIRVQLAIERIMGVGI